MNQGPSAEDFSKSQWEWRTKREASLTKPGGWLSVAGLYWVQEGSQTIGSAESCDIQFPSSAPAKVGTIELKNGVVTLHPRDGVEVSVNGKPLSGPLKTDATGKPDRVKLGDLEFSIIIRGKRTGIRLWDPNSKFRKRFEGCKWFEPDSKYVVKAKYTAYNPARTLSIVNILGDTESPNGSKRFKRETSSSLTSETRLLERRLIRQVDSCTPVCQRTGLSRLILTRRTIRLALSRHLQLARFLLRETL